MYENMYETKLCQFNFSQLSLVNFNPVHTVIEMSCTDLSKVCIVWKSFEIWDPGCSVCRPQ